MIIARTIADVRAAVAEARSGGASIGFVPTMGYLHEGHLSLVDAARENGATWLAVSIFVNPTQFGPKEDFSSYPRDEERDIALLEGRKVDLLFAPGVEEIYPEGAMTTIKVSGVSDALEGERRPGHFEGVATVVAKLFNIVQPDLAVFGQKDAQQCAVIRAMVRDLDLPVRLVFAPTRRESDGLAMSSRNSYLSAEERAIAPALYRALRAGAASLENAAEAMRQELARTPGVQLDYLELVDARTFQPPVDLNRDLIVVGAVRVGRTRLIDNIPIPGGSNDPQLSSFQDSSGHRDGSERGLRGVDHHRSPSDERGRTPPL
jgi:pantoate--beta-alanine ligase